MHRTIIAVAACVAASGGAALVLASGGGAQTPTGQTFTLIEKSKDSDHAFIDNKPYGPVSKKHGPHISRGDEIAWSTQMLDPQGAKAGTVEAHCSATRPGSFDKGVVMVCTGVFRLANGTIAVQTATDVTAKVADLAITGGTGAYAGARGTVQSTTNSDTKSTDVFTLLP